MLQNIGRRLLGALSVTGRFRTAEAVAIDDQLGKIEADLRAKGPVEQVPAEPVPHQKLSKRARARIKHMERCNKGLQYMYNPLLQRLLWSSGAMDAGVKLPVIMETR